MAIEEWDVEKIEVSGVGEGQGDGIVIIPQSSMPGEVPGLGEPLLMKTTGKEKEEEGSITVVLLSVGVAVWGAFVFGSCVGFSAPSQSGMMKDLGLSISEFSNFGSILNVGAMFGATTSGYIADSIGRKGAMRISSIICLLGWMTIYYSKAIIMLCVGRILTGCGIGIFSYVVPIYVAEISPKDLRGCLTTLHQLMVAVGASAMFISGAFLKWRMLILVGALPCLALLIGSIFIPESPRWLAVLGDVDRFKASLQTLRGNGVAVDIEAMEIKDYIDGNKAPPRISLKDILSEKRYVRSITIGAGLMIFQQFSGVGGIGFYLSQLFVDAGFQSGDIGTAIMGSTQIPITLLGAFLADRTGRKPLLMVSAIGTLIGMLATTVTFFLKEQGLQFHLLPSVALVGILFFAGSFSIGMAAIPWVIMSEVFPLNIKRIGGSFVTLVNWFGSWATSYSFNFLMSWSASGTFFIYSFVCASSILFIARVVPETKGKTLEEIQDFLDY